MQRKNVISAIHSFNIVFQAFLTFAVNILIFVLIGWLITEKFGCPMWSYIPLILLGVFSGFFSMIKFIISAHRNLELIEKANSEREKQKNRCHLTEKDDENGEK